MQVKETRTIIAHTLEAQYNSGGIRGFVKPIAEIIDDKLFELNKQNFCQTMKVFIVGGYDDLEKSYPDGIFFKLTVNSNDRPNEKIDPTQACQYISYDRFAESIKPKDYFEIIEAELPDANFRQIALSGPLPGTRYIFIGTEKSLYGPFKSSHYTHLLPISLACVTLRQICLKIEQIFPIWIIFRHLRRDKPLAFLYQRMGQVPEKVL